MRTSLTDTLVEITALSCWNRCCRSDEIQYLHESGRSSNRCSIIASRTSVIVLLFNALDASVSL
ncbi:hypothetical protein VPHD525_0319 [Vibrio phage D525]